MFELNSTVVGAISRELDFCALRHEIYSANIANADVDGYRRLEVEETITSASATGAATSSFDADAGQVMTTSESVKLDQEMAKLSKNALRYETLLSAYEKTSGILSAAIKEGRGE